MVNLKGHGGSDASEGSLTASELSTQHEGGDAVNAPNLNPDGADPEDAAAPAAQPKPRQKKEARKIPRYESASIDEEEFQDCKYILSYLCLKYINLR